MSSQCFYLGDLVWAKMKGFPPWPAKITNPPDKKSTKAKLKTHHQYVYFFGSKNYAWIREENIFHHSDAMVDEARSRKKSAQLTDAIVEILEECKNQPRKTSRDVNICSEASCSSNFFNKCESSKPKKKKIPKVKFLDLTIPLSPEEPVAIPIEEMILTNSESEENESQILNSEEEQEFSNETSNDGGCRAAKSNHVSYFRLGHDLIERRILDPYDRYLVDKDENLPKLKFFPEVILKKCDQEKPCFVELTPVKPVIEIGPSQSIKQIGKKIGFIGLSDVSFGIVKNLIISGHDVMVWDQAPDFYEPIIAAGGKSGETPAEVVLTSDVTMVCLSDPETVREIVFASEGIIKGFDHAKVEKGYIEMSEVDDETSTDVENAIILRGGKYLEASFLKSKKLADQGMLIISVKGDPSLFEECTSCFRAIAEKTFLKNDKKNDPAITNLAVNMFIGNVNCAIAEAMALADHISVPLKEVKDIVHRTDSIYSKRTANTIDAIHDVDFTTDVPLKQMTMTMKTALKSASKVCQPLYATSAAVGRYSKACEKGYGNHDTSSVFMSYYP